MAALSRWKCQFGMIISYPIWSSCICLDESLRAQRWWSWTSESSWWTEELLKGAFSLLADLRTALDALDVWVLMAVLNLKMACRGHLWIEPIHIWPDCQIAVSEPDTEPTQMSAHINLVDTPSLRCLFTLGLMPNVCLSDLSFQFNQDSWLSWCCELYKQKWG